MFMFGAEVDEPTDPVAVAPRGTLSDDEFLPPRVWSHDADDRLVEAAGAGRRTRFLRRLAKCGLPRRARLPRRAADPCRQAAWVFPSADSSAVAHLTRSTLLDASQAARFDATNSVAAMLEAADELAALPPDVLAAWLTLLPTVGPRLEREVLWRLWRRSLEETERLLSDAPPTEADPLSLEAEWRDEIAFRAGIVFASLAEAPKWQREGRAGWRTRIGTVVESSVRPPLGAAQFLEWLAAVVRVTTDARAFDAPLWKKRDVARLEGLFRYAAATLLGDGSMSGVAASNENLLPMLETFGRVLDLEPESPDLRLVAAVGKDRTIARPPRRELRAKRLRPAFQSDTARVALLRNHWGTKAAVCSLNHAGREVQIDFSIGGERLISGTWETRVTIDGEFISINQPWKCECWFSDGDADFIELSVDLGDGASLLRQVFLAREDALAVIAEAVRGVSAEQPVELVAQLPLPTQLLPEADGLTREIQIPLSSRRVRVAPVHLPWERATAAEGSCRIGEEGLLSQIAGRGPRCQVLMLEWLRSDADEPADAAPLSVVENMRRVTPAEACAGRLRVGDRQWLYCHNLTRGAVPRSVLGCHTDSETVVGRVGKGGAVEYLVHVEGDTDAAQHAENPLKSV
jgi:hypothetical protein